MADTNGTRNDEESPTTHLDFVLDDSTMTTSGYAQVVFHYVQERYAPGSHIECKYTLTPAISPGRRDWVGIFKVGWSSTRQYKAFDWAPYPSDWQEGREYEQTVMFNSYYLPKEDDGEFYQFCYIDSAGKMRGASTPFQFLDGPVDELIEIEDKSMGLMMIQTKSSMYEEQLKQIIKEKDELLKDQAEMQTQCRDLTSRMESFQCELGEKGMTLENVQIDYQELNEKHQSLLLQNTILEGRLEEVLNALSSLEQDKTRCEKALETTKIKLQEAQMQNANTIAEKDQLVKDLSQVLHERDEFKSQFASSENSNKDLRSEISNLLKQVSDTSQTSQDFKQHEVLMREEKRKVEKQLLVAKADKDHIRSTEHKLLVKEDQYAACEATRRLLCEEVDTLKAFQHKLSNDLQRAETDKDALKGRLVRQERDFKEREKQLKSAQRLQQHQRQEKETMLQEQVQALKDSIRQLAEEKEQALRSNKGPMKASQVVMEELKEKLKKTQTRLEEETKKRIELQKKQSTLESAYILEKNDITREASDMKVRLQMGAEEYKKKYLECQQLEAKLRRKGDKRSNTPCRDEGMVPKDTDKTQQSAEDEQPLSPGNSCPGTPIKSFDSAEVQMQLGDLARELEDRNVKVKKYKELYQTERHRRQQQDQAFQRERVTFEMQLEAANSCAQELDEKEEDNKHLQEKISKLHADYMKMKHTHEVYKFDVLQNTSPTTKTSPFPRVSPSTTPPEMSPIHSSNDTVVAPQGPPKGQYMYRNPYAAGDEGGCSFRNPYAPPGESGSPKDDIQRSRNPFRVQEKPTAPPLSPPRSPPTPSDTGSPKLTPRSPRVKDSGPKVDLPEPLKPDVLPEGKIAAIKTVAKKHVRLLDLAAGHGPSEGNEDDREEGPNEFHDAVEDLPPSEGDIASDVKRCPECDMHFPPSFPEDDFARHIQLHFARLCPMCNLMMPCEMPNADYEKHVQTHFGED